VVSASENGAVQRTTTTLVHLIQDHRVVCKPGQSTNSLRHDTDQAVKLAVAKVVVYMSALETVAAVVGH